MKRFQFRLASVLHFRQQQLSLEQARLQQLQAELQRMQNAVTQLQESRTGIKEDLLKTPSPDSLTLGAADSYGDFLQARELLAHSQVAASRERLKAQQQRTMEAQRQNRLLELLREKALEAWNRDKDRMEDQDAADTFMAAYQRRQSDEAN